MMVEWTETEVAAFLDGELKGVEHDRIARAIASDPAARALADRLRKVDELLREAYGAALDEPVPHAMRTAIGGHDDNPATADRDGDAGASDSSEVIAFPARHKLRTSWWPMAAAASLALVVGYGAGELVHLDTDDGLAAALAVGPATTAIAEALEHEPSGASRGSVRPVASFLTTQGAYCREFETGDADAPSALGLACRVGEDGWHVLSAMATAGADPQGTADDLFAPASGAAMDAVAPLLDALGAGPTLGPDEERDVIDRGWQ
jgi:hypothetical protein